jgi:hypothetical protein
MSQACLARPSARPRRCDLRFAFAHDAWAGVTFTTIDVPGATGTYAFGISTTQTITGYYTDSSSLTHGFVRAADGTITTFDPPGSVYTRGWSVNAGGTVSGVEHGFLRTK